MGRRDVVEALASRIVTLSTPHPMRVTVDGIDAARKTTLAGGLVASIEAHARPFEHANAIVYNDFDNPRLPVTDR